MFGQENDVQVLVVGGGIAGLSTALMLGRSLIRCCIVDGGSSYLGDDVSVHNFITNDGLTKSNLLGKGRSDLGKYDTVEYVEDKVVSLEKTALGYKAACAGGRIVTTDKIVFATGIAIRPDQLGITGIQDVFGTSLFTCPYCHGFEFRGKNITVLSSSENDWHFLSLLAGWSRNINFVTDGTPVPASMLEKFATISDGEIFETPVDEIVHTDGMVSEVVLKSGDRLPTDVMFMSELPNSTANDLIDALGIQKVMHPQLKKPVYETDPVGRTRMRDIFIIGDAKTGFSTLVGAAHEGTLAGVMMVNDFVEQRMMCA
ncbi:NAD(P)/FAD-dependent oxidoreductase [Kordiimonas aestuarii]|uniref:NAD(P)/FAD-dependent oxidoreductase n=1 Tax=Kordiimonas aestuarii TaxID=1005925 RepID=UPI0021D06832|nr:NAD(P)/FAD-dependent oxidoreductase [Kordiimonas aestuarii]